MNSSQFEVRSPQSVIPPVIFILVILLGILISPKGFAFSRIISLKPNITEILFTLGMGPQVVGVTTYCDRPDAVKKIPIVADYIRVDTEAALALRPDLILGSKENSSQKDVYFLEDRGISVQLLPFSTIAETLRSIEEIGNLLGKEKGAQEITAQMRKELGELKATAQNFPKKKVLFVVGYQPLVVAGQNNFFNDAAEFIAAENVAGKSRMKYPTYTTELLIRAAPEVIIEVGMGTEEARRGESERKEWWKQFSSIPAVRNNRIYSFDIEKMRAVPSLPSAFKELSNLIHQNQRIKSRPLPAGEGGAG